MKSVRTITLLTIILRVFIAEALAAPINLRQALHLALEKNPSLASARAEAAGAKADQRLASSAAQPQINAGFSYTHLTKPTVFGGQEVFRRTTEVNAVTLSLPLLDRAIAANRHAADLASKARDLAADAAAENVMLHTAEAFWAVAAAREQVQAARDASTFLDANAARLKVGFEVGTATKGDLLRAEAEAALAHDQLITSSNSLEIAISRLKFVIGIDQSLRLEVASDALIPDETALTVKEAPAPRILSAQMALEAAEAGIRAAGAGSKPRLSLDADAMGILKGADFPRTDGSSSAMIRLDVPIFDGGLTHARVEKAKAETKKAAEQLKAAQDELAFMRKSTLLALKSARARCKATEKQVAAAVESRRLIDRGAREGIYTQTDLLSAQSGVSSARASRIQSLVDLKVAEAARLAAISRMDILLK